MKFDPEDVGVLKKDVARRLVRTRMALGFDQQTFGEQAGLSQPQYNQYENDRLITLNSALALCEHYNLTLDWIYRGDPSGLPYRLVDEIKKQRSTT